MRKILVLALIGLLLVASIEGAKKGGKAEKGKKGAKEEKGAKAEKAKEPKAKAEKQKKVEEPVAEAEEEVEDPVLEEAVEEPIFLCPHAAGGAHPPIDAAHAKLVKPKSLKVLGQYEQCKMECKKQRDQVTAQQYVEQLKSELAVAEQALTDQAAAVAAAASAVDSAHQEPAVAHHEPAVPDAAHAA